jgi:septum formation protein
MNQSPPRLFLASASPRRQLLLRDAGYEFLVEPAEIDEGGFPPGLLPAELAQRLAREKAHVVASRHGNDIVLAADTVVAFGDQTLGKPANPDDARRMLTLLAGTTHIVITGVSVIYLAQGIEQTRSVMSAVHMRVLIPSDIEAYVASGDWQGKAGGYGIQDRDPFVTRISGSHSNIVGLPMETVAEMLAELGFFPQEDRP